MHICTHPCTLTSTHITYTQKQRKIGEGTERKGKQGRGKKDQKREVKENAKRGANSQHWDKDELHRTDRK